MSWLEDKQHELQQKIDEIDRKLTVGASEIRYGERYLSLDFAELRRQRAKLVAEREALTNPAPVRRFLTYVSGRGW